MTRYKWLMLISTSVVVGVGIGMGAVWVRKSVVSNDAVNVISENYPTNDVTTDSQPDDIMEENQGTSVSDEDAVMQDEELVDEFDPELDDNTPEEDPEDIIEDPEME